MKTKFYLEAYDLWGSCNEKSPLQPFPENLTSTKIKTLSEEKIKRWKVKIVIQKTVADFILSKSLKVGQRKKPGINTKRVSRK